MLFFVIIVYFSFISCYFIFFFSFIVDFSRYARTHYAPDLHVRGFISSDVFERLMSTGREPLSLLICLGVPYQPGGVPSSRFLLNTLIKSLLLRYQVNFVSLSVFTLKETFCPKKGLKSRLKTAKSLLAVNMRRSKASLNKLAIFYLAYRLLSSDQKDCHQTDQKLFQLFKKQQQQQ